MTSEVWRETLTSSTSSSLWMTKDVTIAVHTTWNGMPPDPFAGVREPRRPLPNPAAPSVALEEPRWPSRFQLLVDAIAADQVNNVEGLENATPHLYNAADPQEGTADGKRHISVFPNPITGMRVEPLAMYTHELVWQLVVFVWEDAGSTSSRGYSDADATAAFWELFERSLTRYYVESAQQIDGVEIPTLEQVWFAGLTWPERSGRVRQFSIVLNVRFSQSFT